MFSQPNTIQFHLPDWLSNYTAQCDTIKDIFNRMNFVIEASRLNITKKTGGPFAAAIFEIESGKLVSLGVNLVTSHNLSILHAEMVAISLAQQKLSMNNLGSKKSTKYELVTSTEPCAMCLGAIPWSGVSRVVTGASDADARSIGFDEGCKPENWADALLNRNIDLVQNVKREDAKKVLVSYQQTGGEIYNSSVCE